MSKRKINFLSLFNSYTGRKPKYYKVKVEALVAATREIGLEVRPYKLNTQSCLEIRMQDKFRVRGLIIVDSRVWNIVNIWEQL